MPAPRCHILRLPFELLRLIADALPKSGEVLPPLRLVCKDFENAFFDPWAEKWIGHLCCFLLDPARLRRVKAITSQKHLSKKVKSIKFCFDVWEYRASETSLAPSELSVFSTQHLPQAWDAAMDEEKCRAYEPYLKEAFNTHHQSPDQTLLASIFHDLEPSCRLDLDLTVAHVNNHQHRLMDEVEEVLDSILSGTHFPNLRSLAMDTIEYTPDLLLKFLRCSSSSLEAITLDTDAFIFDEEAWREELATLFNTLLDFPQLNFFRLSNLWEDGNWLQTHPSDETQGRAEVHGHKEIQKFLSSNIEHAAGIFRGKRSA